LLQIKWAAMLSAVEETTEPSGKHFKDSSSMIQAAERF